MLVRQEREREREREREVAILLLSVGGFSNTAHVCVCGGRRIKLKLVVGQREITMVTGNGAGGGWRGEPPKDIDDSLFIIIISAILLSHRKQPSNQNQFTTKDDEFVAASSNLPHYNSRPSFYFCA